MQVLEYAFRHEPFITSMSQGVMFSCAGTPLQSLAYAEFIAGEEILLYTLGCIDNHHGLLNKSAFQIGDISYLYKLFNSKTIR